MATKRHKSTEIRAAKRRQGERESVARKRELNGTKQQKKRIQSYIKRQTLEIYTNAAIVEAKYHITHLHFYMKHWILKPQRGK